MPAQINQNCSNQGRTRSKHIEGSKECYLLGQRHNLHIFMVIPFVKLQNDTTVNSKKTIKNQMRSLITYLFLVADFFFKSRQN